MALVLLGGGGNLALLSIHSESFHTKSQLDIMTAENS
jgi:hypothetical protein